MQELIRRCTRTRFPELTRRQMESVPAWKWGCGKRGTLPQADLCSSGGNERERNNDAVSSARSGRRAHTPVLESIQAGREAAQLAAANNATLQSTAICCCNDVNNKGYERPSRPLHWHEKTTLLCCRGGDALMQQFIRDTLNLHPRVRGKWLCPLPSVDLAPSWLPSTYENGGNPLPSPPKTKKKKSSQLVWHSKTTQQ